MNGSSLPIRGNPAPGRRAPPAADAQAIAVLDALDDAAALYGVGGDFVAGNAVFHRLNGPIAELLGRGVPLREQMAALVRAGLLDDTGITAQATGDGGTAPVALHCQCDADGLAYSVSLRPMATGGTLLLARPQGERRDERAARLAAERKYRDIFDNANDGIYRSSIDGRMLTANPALVRLNGYDSEAELLAAVNDIGREWYVDPGRREEFAEILERDGAVTGFESEVYRHRTRERIWISENARMVRDAAGQPVCYEGTVREITARRMAEQELRASEARFRQAFERGVLGLCIVNAEGTFLQVNQAYCDFFGFSTEELLGRNMDLVIHEDSLGAAQVAVREVTTGGTVEGLFRRRYRHKDGRDIWCRVGLSRLDLPGEDRPYVMVQVQNVTDMQQAEAARQSSVRRFQDLVEGSIQGLYIHRDWNLLFVNEALADMLGYDSVDEIMALGNSGYFYDEADHPRLRTYSAARARGDSDSVPSRYEMQCRRRDGSKLWVEQLVTVIEWGGEYAIQATVIDIDERKKAEFALRAAKEEAERASRSKSEFLANMSHELRTPLNAILGFSEVIVDELFGRVGNERYLDYARDINDSGKHLLRVINDILDLSRVEAGKMELELRPVELTEVTDACFRLLRGRAREASVELSERLDPALPAIVADAVKLKQILINLVTNAIKFTPEGGLVEVIGAPTGDGGVELIVRDTGIGMSEQDIETALTPFGQVESVLARRHHGTGLGLPLVESLVGLHGGRLTIDSTVSSGTTVRVGLPAAPPSGGDG